MNHVVVRPFPFAGNGYTLESLNAGDERDFGSATAGLLAAGLIATKTPDGAGEMSPEQAIAAEIEPETAPRRGRTRK
jgi:hypothetical protein